MYKKNTFNFILFLFCSAYTMAQDLDIINGKNDMPDANIDFNNPLVCSETPDIGHRDGYNRPFEYSITLNNQPGDTWARSLRFRANFDDNCQYSHNNYNQLDWNKLMYISYLANPLRTSVRLGWRWNDVVNVMENHFYTTHLEIK